MSEAEKKWKDFDLHALFIEYSKGTSPAFEYFGKSREAYKAALKREIEKRIKDLPKGFTYPMSAQELL